MYSVLDKPKMWISNLKALQKVLKCQLISKGLFCVFNSSKKQTKNFYLSRLGQKLKFSCSFFGRIEDTKKTFRNWVPFNAGLENSNLHKTFTDICLSSSWRSSGSHWNSKACKVGSSRICAGACDYETRPV